MKENTKKLYVVTNIYNESKYFTNKKDSELYSTLLNSISTLKSIKRDEISGYTKEDVEYVKRQIARNNKVQIER